MINLILDEEYVLKILGRHKERKYLHIVTYNSLEESNSENKWEGKIKVLKDQMAIVRAEIGENFGSFENQLSLMKKNQDEKIEKIMKNIEELKKNQDEQNKNQ